MEWILRGSWEELRSYCTIRPATSCNLPTTEKQGNSFGRRAQAGVGAYNYYIHVLVYCSNFVIREFLESLAVHAIYILI